MLDGIFNDQPESPIVRAELYPISRKLPIPSTEEGSNWLPKNRYLQLNTLGLSVYIKQSGRFTHTVRATNKFDMKKPRTNC